MGDRTFTAVIRISVAGSAQGTGIYDVNSGQNFVIRRIQQRSTGNFDILDIEDQAGNSFTNANSTQPLGGNYYTDIDANNNNPSDLTDDIVIPASGSIKFTIVDTSTTNNDVDIILSGQLQDI